MLIPSLIASPPRSSSNFPPPGLENGFFHRLSVTCALVVPSPLQQGEGEQRHDKHQRLRVCEKIETAFSPKNPRATGALGSTISIRSDTWNHLRGPQNLAESIFSHTLSLAAVALAVIPSEARNLAVDVCLEPHPQPGVRGKAPRHASGPSQ